MYRSLAHEYSLSLRPDASSEVWDALQLTTLCNKTKPPTPPPMPLDGPPPSPGAVYVATTGSDANPGTKASPLKTIGAGITAARKLPAGAKSLLIGAGTYALSATLQLDARDSQLTMAPAEPSGKVSIAGGADLPKVSQWKPHKVSNSTAWSVLPGQNSACCCGYPC